MSEKIDSGFPSASALMENRTQIVDLNEHCLEKLFSYLAPIELCAVKTAFSAYDRLVAEADRKFKKLYGHQELTFRPNSKTGPAPNKFDVPSSVLQAFGNVIKKLKVTDILNIAQAEKLWRVILGNCTQLSELCIINCNLETLKPTKDGVIPQLTECF